MWLNISKLLIDFFLNYSKLISTIAVAIPSVSFNQLDMQHFTMDLNICKDQREYRQV